MRTEARGGVALGQDQGAVPVSRYLVFTVLVAAGTWWDLWTKSSIFSELGCPGRAEWEWRAGDLVRFVLQTNLNFGALWGIGQGWTGLFAVLSVFAALGVLYFLFVLRYARSWWLTISLGLVLAGALGNLYDRLGLHGLRDAVGQPVYAVRDFLYFRFFETFDWAIFNFADSYLVVGAIMLVLHSFWPEPVAVGDRHQAAGISDDQMPKTTSAIS